MPTLLDRLSFSEALDDVPVSLVERIVQHDDRYHTINMLTPIAMGALSLPTLHYFGDPWFHAAGLLIHLAGRSLDFYSTYCAFARVHEADAKNIEHPVIEGNPALPEKPQIRDLFHSAILFIEGVYALMSLVVPPAGLVFLIRDSITYVNNKNHERRLARAIAIHDQNYVSAS